ncbi:unnamed protein product [Heligmosomoides polygyrus]|uniref:DUF1376 domain-containing protein n=1 Tax=Heligmosomoides polygyrus TaxID=6339 RepID=A0A183F8U5_HELPZ|nr:unnamed protein product [Heligmosomoides polygyrus]
MSTYERQKIFQENVNRRVLLDWVRVTGLPTNKKKSYDQLLSSLAYDILEYPREKPEPFSWATQAGFYGNHEAIRARLTYDFWKFFMREGRKNLYDYNLKNNTDIKISREKTLSLQEQDRLYIRKLIKERYRQAGLRGKEIAMVKGKIRIGEEPLMKPAVAAVKLNVTMREWNGSKLDEMLTQDEKKSIEEGKLVYGSLQLEGIDVTEESVNEEANSEEQIVKTVSWNR